MKPKGQDVASAVKAWFRGEIENGPARRHELGKFFLGASTASVGLFVSLIKLESENSELEQSGFVAVFMFLASMICAILMSLPRSVSVNSNLDLYEAYNEAVSKTMIFAEIWFLLWGVGLLCSGARLFL